MGLLTWPRELRRRTRRLVVHQARKSLDRPQRRRRLVLARARRHPACARSRRSRRVHGRAIPCAETRSARAPVPATWRVGARGCTTLARARKLADRRRASRRRRACTGPRCSSRRRRARIRGRCSWIAEGAPPVAFLRASLTASPRSTLPRSTATARASLRSTSRPHGPSTSAGVYSARRSTARQ